MPNDSLLAALDRARETYSQRQKTAASLLAALKGTTGALGKTSRALRDYAEQNQAAQGDGLAQARHAFGTLRLREEAIDPLLPELRREVKVLTGLNTALKDALAALRGESVDVVKLGRSYSALQNAKVQDEGLAALMPGIEQELAEAQRALGNTFGLALRHALAEQGIELGGRPPRFEIGRFELVADFVNRSASLSYGKNLVARRIPLSVEQVVKSYQREAKAIMGRNEDGARWIEQLYTAWETVRRKRGTSELRVSIVECFFEMVLLRQARNFRNTPSKNSFVEYSRAQFAYDFFLFTAEQRLAHKGLHAFGLVATKSQTENPDRSIWIVEGDSPHIGNYIADLKFDRDE